MAAPCPLTPRRRGEAYRLAQTDTDVTVTVAVPPTIRGKFVDVAFARTSLRVAVRGVVVMDGALHGDVKADECTWSIDEDSDGRKVLIIHLEKAPVGYGGSRYWPRLLKADGEGGEEPGVEDDAASTASSSSASLGCPGGIPYDPTPAPRADSDGLYADDDCSDMTDSDSRTPSTAPSDNLAAGHMDPMRGIPAPPASAAPEVPAWASKKRWQMFTRPVCYATLAQPGAAPRRAVRSGAEELEAGGFVRCEGCGVAWYRDRETMAAHRACHSGECRPPAFDRIDALDSEDVWEEARGLLQRQARSADLAALLNILLYRLLRDDTEGVDVEEVSHCLHVATRVDARPPEAGASAPATADADPLLEYHRAVWALPGMPQLLLFTDLLSSGYRRVRALYPEGLYFVPDAALTDKMEDCVLQHRPEWGESEVEPIVAWHLGYLVRSAVKGELHDKDYRAGVGHLRDTPFAQAAVRRIMALVAQDDLLHSCGFGALTVPHFLACLAGRAPDVFFSHYRAGVLRGLFLWVGGLGDGGVEPALAVMRAVEQRAAAADPTALPLAACHETLAVVAGCWNDGTARRPWGFPATPAEDKARLDTAAASLVATLLRVCTPAAVAAHVRRKQRPPLDYHTTELRASADTAVLEYLAQRAAAPGACTAEAVAGWLAAWGAEGHGRESAFRAAYYSPAIMPAPLALALQRRCRPRTAS